MRIFVLAALVAFSCHALADKILIIGDSISCGPFGSDLVQGLGEQGHDVKLYCSVGSSPSDWLAGRNAKKTPDKNDPLPYWRCETRTYDAAKKKVVPVRNCDGDTHSPNFDKILERNPSDRVMVALGTNSLSSPLHLGTDYSRMLSKISTSGRTCTWIGPPHFQPAKAGQVLRLKKNETAAHLAARRKAAVDNLIPREAGLNSFYTSEFPKAVRAADTTCPLLDSRDATKPGTPGNNTGEGIHATEAAAAYRFEQMKSAIYRATPMSAASATSGEPAATDDSVR